MPSSVYHSQIPSGDAIKGDAIKGDFMAAITYSECNLDNGRVWGNDEMLKVQRNGAWLKMGVSERFPL